jgi:hypothetical protein
VSAISLRLHLSSAAAHLSPPLGRRTSGAAAVLFLSPKRLYRAFIVGQRHISPRPAHLCLCRLRV